MILTTETIGDRKQPNLYKEANETIADLLIGCGEENQMCVYAGFYIKSLEEKIKKLEMKIRELSGLASTDSEFGTNA